MRKLSTGLVGSALLGLAVLCPTGAGGGTLDGVPGVGGAGTTNSAAAALTSREFPARSQSSFPLMAQLDGAHDRAYETAQRKVETMDCWFVPSGQEPKPVPPPRFRLGTYLDATMGPGSTNRVRATVETEADIRLPNAERRLRLFLTTVDPADLPGQDLTERDRNLRLGLARGWLRDIDTAVGVRLKVKPEAYTKISWRPAYQEGDWRFYPNQKLYWESKEGYGEVSSFTVDHWRSRWDLRSSSALKWSQQQHRLDDVADNGDGGWQWGQTFLAGYAKELLDEQDVGHLVDGSDYARGAGVRVTFLGDPHGLDTLQLAFFLRAPLHKRWLYGVFEPGIEWNDAHNWECEFRLRVGVDLLFWGQKDR